MSRRILGAVGRFAAGVGLMLLAASLTNVLFCRSWAFTWGATTREAAAVMPGDELVAQPGTVSTRAVTIDAPVDYVWPWLVQFGQGRGGLYSYDWAERLVGVDVTNADRILPGYQTIAVGDLIWVTHEGYAAGLVFAVAEVVPLRTLVLAFAEDPRPGVVPAQTAWTWSFALASAGPDRTRLILRSRNQPFPNPIARGITATIIDPIDFVMGRKTLLGIRERAERLAGRDPSSPAEPLLWLALGLGAAGATVLAVTRRLPAPYRLGVAAAAAGLLTLALFRGFPNPWYAIGVDALLVGAMILTFRPAWITRRRTATPAARRQIADRDMYGGGDAAGHPRQHDSGGHQTRLGRSRSTTASDGHRREHPDQRGERGPAAGRAAG